MRRIVRIIGTVIFIIEIAFFAQACAARDDPTQEGISAAGKRSNDVAEQRDERTDGPRRRRRKPPGYVMHFPAERSLGQLFTAPEPTTAPTIAGTPYLLTWRLLGEARGDVVVPFQNVVKLVVSPEGAEDLSPLDDTGRAYLMFAVDFSRTDLDDERLAFMSGLKGFRRVDLRNTRITDDGLRHLKGLRRLELLNLYGTRVTEEGIAEIKEALPYCSVVAKRTAPGPGMRVISFPVDHCLGRINFTDPEEPAWWKNYNAAQGDFVAPIAAPLAIRVYDIALSELLTLDTNWLKDVKELHVENTWRRYKLTNSDLQDLKVLSGLEVLTLIRSSITDAQLAHLAVLPQLKELALRYTSVTDAGLAHLRALPSLERIGLWDTAITDKGLARLSKMRQLTSLRIGGPQITDRGMAYLGRLPRLEKLGVTDARVTGRGLAHFRKVNSLKDLFVHGVPLGDADLARLKVLGSLERLRLYGARITGEGLKHLARLTSLEQLTLYEAPISGAGVAHLTALASLKKLDLSGTPLTDEAIPHLKQLPSLVWLNVDRTQLTPEGLEVLRQALPDCKVWPR